MAVSDPQPASSRYPARAGVDAPTTVARAHTTTNFLHHVITTSLAPGEADDLLHHPPGWRYSVRITASAGSSPSRWASARSTYAWSFDSSVSFTAYSASPSLG